MRHRPDDYMTPFADVTANTVKIGATRVDHQLRFLYGCDLNPDFQREHVWTKTQQKSFLEWFISYGSHVSLQLPGNTITINQVTVNGRHTEKCELIDGKQRLKAIQDFLDGEIDPFGVNIEYWDFSGAMTFGIFVRVTGMSRVDSMGYYLSINSAGVPHTKEELDKVKDLIELSTKD